MSLLMPQKVYFKIENDVNQIIMFHIKISLLDMFKIEFRNLSRMAETRQNWCSGIP